MNRLSLLLFLAGCGGATQLPQHPFQDTAVSLVWDETLGAQTPPPPIEWHEDTCPTSKSKDAAVVVDGKCYAGLFLRDDKALIAWRGSYSSSAFAHELVHAWQWSRGIDDPDHELKADWKLADEANKKLRKQGW